MNPIFYIWRKSVTFKPGKTRQGMTRHGKARPGEARRGKTRRRPDKKVSPGFEKYCMSADLHEDTSSLQPVLQPTEGNPGSGAFPGDGEQLPRVNMDQADGMSRRVQAHNEQELVSL